MNKILFDSRLQLFDGVNCQLFFDTICERVEEEYDNRQKRVELGMWPWP